MHSAPKNIKRSWKYQKTQTATKRYFAFYKFNVDVHFLMFFVSSKNDATKCPKKGYETGKTLYYKI